MKVWAIAVLCACSSGHRVGPATGAAGSESASVPPATAVSCADVRPRVEQLYRAEALVKDPKRVEDAVADNTAMAMKDCAQDSGKTVPCLARVGSVAELEKQCLIQLDDDGAEGAALSR